MKTSTLLLAASLVALYSSQSFANGAACPNNEDRYTKPSDRADRVVAALGAQSVKPQPSIPTRTKKVR